MQVSTILWTFLFIVVFGGLFMVVTVIRNKYMGSEVPEHFHGCSSHREGDCSVCESPCERKADRR